jgi:hypothetical protein
MQVGLLDSDPFQVASLRLRPLMVRARRIDAAVAFITGAGTQFVKECLALQPTPAVRLVASVRFPTDLGALAGVAGMSRLDLRLHVRTTKNVEPRAERGQLHSKLVLLELDGDERVVVVGSHNWTGFALNGINLEAGVIIHCVEQDSIAGEVRRHIARCALISEAFDPNRLPYYQAVQRDLHVGPGNNRGEPFPGFIDNVAVVILAENHADAELPLPLRVFVPPPDERTTRFFPYRRQAYLCLFPPGSLFGHQQPQAAPVVYAGQVSMNNEPDDDPNLGRAANVELRDLSHPRLTVLPAGVPPPSGEDTQIIVTFDRRVSGELPVFHAGNQGPRVALSLTWATIDRDQPTESTLATKDAGWEPEQRSPNERIPEYQTPDQLNVEGRVCVPRPELYGAELERRLQYALQAARLFEVSRVPTLRLSRPPKPTMLTEYVYGVTHRLNDPEWRDKPRQEALFPS